MSAPVTSSAAPPSSSSPASTSAQSTSSSPSPSSATSAASSQTSNPASPSDSSDPGTPTTDTPPTSPPPTSPPPTSPPTSPPPTSPPTSGPPSVPTSGPSSPSSPSSPDNPPPSSPPSSDGGGGGQSSDAGAGGSSTPPANGSSAGSDTSSAPPVLPSSITSTTESTFLTTNAAGETITSTVEKTIVISPSRLPGSGGSNSDVTHSSSHTGAIVGGVVGGILGLLALVILGWWFTKQWRKRREMEEFDGDFDPDRVVGGRVLNGAGNLDLAAGEGRVVPYSYAPSGGPSSEMSQAGGSILGAGAAGIGAGAIGTNKAGPPPSSFNYNQTGARPGPPTAPSAYSQPSAYSTSEQDGAVPYGQQSQQGHSRNLSQASAQQHSAYGGYSDAGGSNLESSEGGVSSPRSSGYPPALLAGAAYAPNVNEWRHPSPGPSLPSAGTTGTLPSNKELEARGLRVANQPGFPGEGSGPVVQHQDGGRVHDEPPAEIPPSYDSIRD